MQRTRGIRLLGAVALALVVGASPSFADNIILNGSFESGNTGFDSDYSYVAVQGSQALWAEGTYAVGGNANDYHYLWSPVTPRSGSKMMMIVNGATKANEDVWFADVTTIAPSTTYYFSAWIASVYPSNPAVLEFSINGTPIGVPFTAPATPGTWQQFYATWNSGDATSARLSIVNRNIEAGGNDFTLDDISLDTPRPPGTDTTVPEPASLVLLGTGLLGAGRAWRKRRQ